MKTVRIGVVGCVVMGPKHLASAAKSPLAEPVAVADLIPERGRAAAEKVGVGRVWASGDQLVKDPEVDAVVLALPARDRARLALRALAAGKHVLTEKPVAMNAGQVRRMLRAQGRRVVACCSSRFRFLPHAKVAARFLARGTLGKLRLVRARHLVPCGPKPDVPRPDWRLTRELNGGGILFNWGCYDLDYLLGLVGWKLRPRTVLAQAWPISPHLKPHIARGSNAETYYAALVRCDGGTVLSLERGEFMPAAADAAWQIVGTRGSLRMMMTPGKGKQLVHDDTTTARGVASRTLWEGDEAFTDVGADWVHDFAEAILRRRRPATDLKRSLVVQQISDAIIASAERGRAVTIR